MDDKLSAMSSALLSQFTVMLDQFKLGITNSSISENPVVPAYSVSQTEPPSLRHPVSTEYQQLWFQDGGEDPVPHGSGLAQGAGVTLDRPELGKDAAGSQEPPSEGHENAQRPQGLSGPRLTFAQPLMSVCTCDLEEEEDEDRDSVAEPPVVDKTLSRLFNFIYDKFENSHPLTDESTPPRYDFEEYFSMFDPPPSLRQHLRVYPRVSETIDASSEKATRLARKSRPLHRVVPLKCKIFNVGDDQDFCSARFVNPDYSRISNLKSILKSRLSSVSLADLEKIERASRTVIAGDSQCF